MQAEWYTAKCAEIDRMNIIDKADWHKRIKNVTELTACS